MRDDLTDREKMLLKKVVRREDVRRGTATTGIVLGLGLGVILLILSIPQHGLGNAFRLIGVMLIAGGLSGLFGRLNHR